MRTDHAALKFLRNFADYSRLMHWSLCLSEFDFEIEHARGSKIKHMDALSRHDELVGETSAFFQETCKILKVRKVITSAYHAMSNRMVERFHRVLHDSTAHYIDSTGTNWDVELPFFLMANRATPHSMTGYRPFYLLHGPEMVLRNEGD